MKHVIDAKNKKIGRIASQAAMILMGKNAPTYERNKVAVVEVEIINTSKADISVKRKEQEVHPRFSGYNSGMKIDTIGHVISKKGYSEVFRKAVYGMLPGNKLRPIMMKHLKISE